MISEKPPDGPTPVVLETNVSGSYYSGALCGGSEQALVQKSYDYHFVTRWRVEASAQEVTDVFDDALDLVRWRPDIYLEVKEIQKGDDGDIGQVYSLLTKGWLFYRLRWSFRVVESRKPFGGTLETWGDFAGRGIWTFEEQERWVNITYDWKIRAEKRLLRYLSFVLKPIFGANHGWAMARREDGLK